MTKREKIDWLIDEVAPNKGNSSLINFNKQRLKDEIETLITEGEQQQTFKVVQSLVKANAISDTVASQTLALFQASMKGDSYATE